MLIVTLVILTPFLHSRQELSAFSAFEGLFWPILQTIWNQIGLLPSP